MVFFPPFTQICMLDRCRKVVKGIKAKPSTSCQKKKEFSQHKIHEVLLEDQIVAIWHELFCIRNKFGVDFEFDLWHKN